MTVLGILLVVLAVTLVPGGARASLPVDATVPAQLLSALQRMGCTPIPACVDAVAEGLGNAVRTLGMSQGAGPSAWASREVARSIGQEVAGHSLPWSSILQKLPANLRGPQLVEWLRGGNTYVSSVQSVLSRGQLLELNTVAAQAQNAARAVQSGTAAVQGEGTAGAWIRTLGESARARFGQAIAMETTSLAARFLAGGIVAGVAGAAILAVLREYQGQMQSLGDAAEAAAYNNDVRLLLDAIRSKRQQLATGLTLGDALVRLRVNLASGGPHFDGIFKARPGPPIVKGQPLFVYYDVNEFTCCKDGTAPPPHPIRVGPVTQWSPSLRRLAGPFDSRSDAERWICQGRTVYPHHWARAWARFGDTILTQVPCPITAR